MCLSSCLNEETEIIIDIDTVSCVSHCDSGYYNKVNGKYVCLD